MAQRDAPPPMPEGYDRAYSVSQYELFMLCPHRWQRRYILKEKGPDHPAAALGTEVHAHMEAADVEGRFPPDTKAGRLAKALIVLDNAPEGTKSSVEGHFYFKLAPDVLYQGYADKVEVFPLPHAYYKRVIDYKTTSDFQYAKTAEQLLADPQAVLYLAAFEADQAEWRYAQTKGDKEGRTKRVAVAREDADVEGVLALLLEVGRKLNHAHANPEMVLDGNLAACKLYPRDGCPYKAKCSHYNRPRTPRGNPFMTDTTKAPTAGFRALLNKVAQGKAATPPATETSKTAPASLPPAADVAAAPKSKAELLKEQLAAAEAAEAAEALRLQKEQDDALAALAQKEADRLSSIAALNKAAEELPDAPTGAGKKARTKKVDALPPPAKLPSIAPNAELFACGGRQLLIDIVVEAGDTGPAMDISVLYQRAHALVKEGLGVTHYSAIEYGKGAAAFVEAFQEVFTNEIGSDTQLVVSSSASEWFLVQSFVRCQGFQVLRGTR